MAHTVEWKVRLYLFEEERTTKARVVLDTGVTVLTGRGVARCGPEVPDVPEIGDELAAGRALEDLARQLTATAERDMADTGPPRTGPAGGRPQ